MNLRSVVPAALGVALAVVLSCASSIPQQRSPIAPAIPALLTRKDVVRRVLPENVRVMVYDGETARRTASGVALATEHDANGTRSYVVTNAHVTDTSGLTAPRFKILVEHGPDVTSYDAEPIARGSVPEMDLALLRVPGIALPTAELANDDDFELGQDVVVAAAPYGRALSISSGILSQVEWDRQTRHPTMIKTDAPIGYGASGGGVYSIATGHLVAIVEGYRTAKIGFDVADQPYSFEVPMPGETFGAPAAKIRHFLERNGLEALLLMHEPPASTVSAR